MYFNVVEMCSYIFICFYIGFTRSKNSYNAVLQNSDLNMIQGGIELSFFDFLWKKQTVV